ncbi:hypothetical protein [Parasediminibacterium sp. JCM 36343]|uniref:hypothetical protein n=1 Tax=Parasediminibacterium sp. JCM 36343 TaxID=3374279 RepID=UPI00397B790B
MKYILLILLSAACSEASAQGDFVLLRKKGIVTQSYFVGTYMQCQLSNGQWVEGRIKKVKTDSLFVEQLAVRQVGNYWGVATLDTVHYGMMKLALADIHALPLKEKGIGMIKDGSLFSIGAAAYIGLNLFNGLVLKGQSIGTAQNLTNLGIAGGVFLVGRVLHWTHPTSIVIGKKYTLSTTAQIPLN